MLRDIDLAPSYRSGHDSILDDFYIPCLEESVRYDRAVGFFSSSLLHVAAIAYSDFAKRDGRMRLICSPALTQGDFDAMKEASDLGVLAQERFQDEFAMLLNNPSTLPAARLLATLIAIGVLDVRLAFSNSAPGIFHDKLGIFEDDAGKRVSFVGSANETYAAWGLNHESFEVFRSWNSADDLLRTRRHSRTFDNYWANLEEGLTVEALDQVSRDRLVESSEEDLDAAIRSLRRVPSSIQTGRTLMDHQELALANWKKNLNRGVVSFATGAGKTLVALRAIHEWTDHGDPAIVIVPSRELHQQWLEELRTEIPNTVPLLCGAGHPPNQWAQHLRFVTERERHVGMSRIVLATNRTFSSKEFQSRFEQGDHLLVVADEVHRLGSRKGLEVIENLLAGARMGLSATYRRQFDEAGTQTLMAWFGDAVEPVIGIGEAILIGRLVPYDYQLHTVELTEIEAATYEQLTKKIKKLVAMEHHESEMSFQLRHLLLARARVLKNASTKVQSSVDILTSEYQDGDRWLVYCDNKSQLASIVQLCLAVGLPVMEYHTSMEGEREPVLKSLEHFGGIVVAIKCLDEGIDIPVCDHALIVASSTVEREYIQRRGRVLRTAPGKTDATVHDLLVVNRDGGALTRGEAVRALDFARLASNSGARERLKILLALSPDIDLTSSRQGAVVEEEDMEEEDND